MTTSVIPTTPDIIEFKHIFRDTFSTLTVSILEGYDRVIYYSAYDIGRIIGRLDQLMQCIHSKGFKITPGYSGIAELTQSGARDVVFTSAGVLEIIRTLGSYDETVDKLTTFMYRMQAKHGTPAPSANTPKRPCSIEDLIDSKIAAAFKAYDDRPVIAQNSQPVNSQPSKLKMSWFKVLSASVRAMLDSGEYSLIGIQGHCGIQWDIDAKKLGYMYTEANGNVVYLIYNDVLVPYLSKIGIRINYSELIEQNVLITAGDNMHTVSQLYSGERVLHLSLKL